MHSQTEQPRFAATRPAAAVGRLVMVSLFLLLHPSPVAASGVTQLCAGNLQARAHCSVVRLDPGQAGVFGPTTVAYGPADIQGAYALDTSQGTGRTVAIVGAYNDPNAETDLAAYRTHYGLVACTTANSCFNKVNQNGATSPLPADSPVGDDWSVQDSLEMDMVSAACPACNILLVEADNDTGEGLYVSINTAASMPGVVAVVAPFGAPEYPGETADELTYLFHPGIAIVAPAGDNGYGVNFPAASRYVVAVGGTTLTHAANGRGWSEVAWSSTGSGCSAYVAKPSFQNDAGCSTRTINDIAAVADPNTGVEVYNQTYGGFFAVGGTAGAAAIVAGAYALADPSTFPGWPASYPYRNANKLYDITAGTNGACGNYLCKGATGYDGPSGNGALDTAAALIDDTVFANGFETVP